MGLWVRLRDHPRLDAGPNPNPDPILERGHRYQRSDKTTLRDTSRPPLRSGSLSLLSDSLPHPFRNPNLKILFIDTEGLDAPHVEQSYNWVRLLSA